SGPVTASAGGPSLVVEQRGGVNTSKSAAGGRRGKRRLEEVEARRWFSWTGADSFQHRGNEPPARWSGALIQLRRRPDPDALVPTAAGQVQGLRAEGHRRDIGRMPTQQRDLLAGPDVPGPDRPVLARTARRIAVQPRPPWKRCLLRDLGYGMLSDSP